MPIIHVVVVVSRAQHYSTTPPTRPCNRPGDRKPMSSNPQISSAITFNQRIEMSSTLELIVLGSGPSGGLPQLGCLTRPSDAPYERCRCCESTREETADDIAAGGRKNRRGNTSCVVRKTWDDGTQRYGICALACDCLIDFVCVGMSVVVCYLIAARRLRETHANGSRSMG